ASCAAENASSASGYRPWRVNSTAASKGSRPAAGGASPVARSKGPARAGATRSASSAHAQPSARANLNARSLLLLAPPAVVLPCFATSLLLRFAILLHPGLVFLFRRRGGRIGLAVPAARTLHQPRARHFDPVDEAVVDLLVLAQHLHRQV